MKKFYLIANTEKNKILETMREIKSYLEEQGAICLTQLLEKKVPMGKYRYTNAALVPKDTECIIVLGGDGTLIQAARDLAGMEIPFIGVNLGTLGYLAEVGKDDSVYPMLDSLLNNNYLLEKRMMIVGNAFRGDKLLHTDMALNDVVITRSGLLRMTKFNVYVNEEFLYNYSADGMIIATPTGSTAYNLSAGGPIVSPDASMILMTPVCPHSLNARSIVLSSEDKITIEICGTEENDHVVVFDGDTTLNLNLGDRIKLSKASMVTKTIKLSSISFLENLRNKITGL